MLSDEILLSKMRTLIIKSFVKGMSAGGKDIVKDIIKDTRNFEVPLSLGLISRLKDLGDV